MSDLERSGRASSRLSVPSTPGLARETAAATADYAHA